MIPTKAEHLLALRPSNSWVHIPKQCIRVLMKGHEFGCLQQHWTGNYPKVHQQEADKHVLVYLYHCAAMRRNNVSLHRVIRKALTNRSINRKADKHILVYWYCCATRRRNNVSLHRVIRKALTNRMLTERSQEKRSQAVSVYLYRVQRQAKGISAIRGQAIVYPKGEKLCLEWVFGGGGFWGCG